jgi:hypothetical protein
MQSISSSAVRAGRAEHGRIVRVVFRAAASLLLGLGGFGIAGAPACGDPATCGGNIDRACSDFSTDECPKAPGCHAVPGRCASVEEQGCVCASSGNTCKSGCDCAGDEASCRSNVASTGIGSPEIQQCMWDGSTCKSLCPPITTPDACRAQQVAGCTWIECAGQPKGPCSAYSGDNCPTLLGCDRVAHSGLSLQ